MFKRTLTLVSLSLILLASCGSEATSVSTPAIANGANTGTPPAGMPPNGQQAPGGRVLPPNAEELRIQYPEFIAALEAIEKLDPQDRAKALDALFVDHPEWKDLMPAPPAGGAPGGQPPAGGGPNGAPPQRPGAPMPSPSAA